MAEAFCAPSWTKVYPPATSAEPVMPSGPAAMLAAIEPAVLTRPSHFTAMRAPVSTRLS